MDGITQNRVQTMISNESIKGLTCLGRQLRELRPGRNDRQSDFAARWGVSIPTLRKLEQGDPAVAIGTWIIPMGLLWIPTNGRWSIPNLQAIDPRVSFPISIDSAMSISDINPGGKCLPAELYYGSRGNVDR